MLGDPENKPLINMRALLKAKREIRQDLNAEEESGGHSVWNFFDSNVRDYEISFREVLDQLGIPLLREWMKQRKENGGSAFVLDIMGGEGKFLDDLRNGREFFFPEKKEVVTQKYNQYFDGGLAVTLVDKRWQEWKEDDKEQKINVVSADVTTKKGWSRISEWQKENGIREFDLIIERGVQGVDNIPLELIPFLFGQVYQRLSSNDGLFIGQLPHGFESNFVRWRKQLESIPGIRVFFQQPKPLFPYEDSSFPVVAILKTKEAPESIEGFIK